MTGTLKLLLWAALALPLLAAPDAQAGAFPDVAKIERSLVRGVSNKQDVRELLGLPDGTGEAMFPPDHRRHRIWYYEDLEIEDYDLAGGGAVYINMRQRLLMIYFDGDVFDGFNWTSNILPTDVFIGVGARQ